MPHMLPVSGGLDDPIRTTCFWIQGVMSAMAITQSILVGEAREDDVDNEVPIWRIEIGYGSER